MGWRSGRSAEGRTREGGQVGDRRRATTSGRTGSQVGICRPPNATSTSLCYYRACDAGRVFERPADQRLGLLSRGVSPGGPGADHRLQDGLLSIGGVVTRVRGPAERWPPCSLPAQPVFWRPAATPFTVSSSSLSIRSRSCSSSTPPRSARSARSWRWESAST